MPIRYREKRYICIVAMAVVVVKNVGISSGM